MQPFLDRLMPWLAYPLVVGGGILLHLTLLSHGFSIVVSTYTPVLLGAAAVTWLEWCFPHLPEWRPTRSDITHDLWFMAIIQILLPKLLVLMVVFALVEPIRAQHWPLSHVWPHHWAIWQQTLLMLMIVDFTRYWLHRSAHKYGFLWRFHAVHHSSNKLYWLNVGRFHPIDKALQFLLDALPFILLGVTAPVLGFYYVIYSLNGFFQHSNIRLRFGFLNYVISSPELHRWHHSRLPAESDSNFANHTILWDMLFGTRFLPTTRSIRDIGLLNRNYPMSFLAQMRTPFIPDLTTHDVPLRPSPFGRAVFLHLLRGYAGVRFAWPLHRQASRPHATQLRVLRRILQHSRNTEFGRVHDFVHIGSIADFQRSVPIHTYEELGPSFDRQEHSGDEVLYRGKPLFYARTSGTTGVPKLIPVLASTLRQYCRQQYLTVYFQLVFCPGAFHGKALGISSAAIEDTLNTGTPVGSASGYLYRAMPDFMRANYVVPAEVFEIRDYALKYRVILRLALQEDGISYVGGANSSSFLRLLDGLQQERGLLIDSLLSGELAGLETLAPRIQHAIHTRLRPHPQRALQLQRDPNHPLTYRELWPDIRLFNIWTGGSCSIALEALRQKLPAQTCVVELGYLASEMRGSITLNFENGGGIPPLGDYFFEFVERDAWEAGSRDCQTLNTLQNDRHYYVLVTTDYGLYRYFMNDIVRVVGFHKHTPLIRFVQKGKGVTSITGEKMYEAQVITALENTVQALGVPLIFMLMLADEPAGRYHFYYETEAAACEADALVLRLDHELSHINIEYAAKRASGRLGLLATTRLQRGTGEAYKIYCLNQGQREAQFKPAVLQLRSELQFPLEHYCEQIA
jgi:sterol desaturase/sphingolipid hydroxylase (fatty acid hydroxylase superfamily)